MRRTGSRLAAPALAVGVLTGCASGPIPTLLTVSDQQPQSVLIQYTSNLFGYGGKLWTTLPSGETFTGNYRLEPLDPSRQMTSTLNGNRGNTLVCRFTLTQPGVGPDGGGTVQCGLSTGGTLEGRF
ncbi:MAG TPA: hypothetical protein VFN71_13130 [Methylomirabilota bacterium]|nr:hypothetical protein [Methylomirabilota bacterium]